jgi:hypothetical protein
MVKTIVRTSAAAVVSLGLVAAFSGIAGASAGITNTGPDSNNGISSSSSNTVEVTNHNTVGVSNWNFQAGLSGKSEVKHNTTGGDATSGDVSNSNTANANVTVDNSGSDPSWTGSANDPSMGDATITETGPDSNNYITSTSSNDVSVENTNCVTVDNSSVQLGGSGNASVNDNTTGGSATSGSVSNTNSSSDTISISN